MQTAPLYDLMLLLSAAADEDRREQILADVRSAIEGGGGTISLDDDWGQRATTFEISHQAEAVYRLIQFSGPTAVLDPLSHLLRIADGVLRFRIIKVTPGTPPAPSAPPAGVAVGAGASSAE